MGGSTYNLSRGLLEAQQMQLNVELARQQQTMQRGLAGALGQTAAQSRSHQSREFSITHEELMNDWGAIDRFENEVERLRAMCTLDETVTIVDDCARAEKRCYIERVSDHRADAFRYGLAEVKPEGGRYDILKTQTPKTFVEELQEETNEWLADIEL